MKNMFKLAAVAVSMVLATSFVACSSGDDVVDTTTPEYLLSAKSDSYFASLKYAQNVPDTEIKSLTDTYEGITKIGDGCADCLEQYYEAIKGIFEEYGSLTSSDIETAKDELGKLKTEFGKDTYHKVNVYKPAIEEALDKLYKAEAKVDDIENIVEGKLNDRQSDSMAKYLEAAAALKTVLSDADKTEHKTTIEAADTAITNFNKLKKVAKSDITTLTTTVSVMAADINTNIVNKI